MRKTAKKNEIAESTIKSIDVLFRQYFDNYFSQHREVKNMSYYRMNDNSGLSVILDYDNFKQYVNYFYDYFSIENAVVNTCFEFDFNGIFLCNFDDVLDMIDSDDLSFYTYLNCFENKAVINALDNIMQAVNKYLPYLNNIAVTPGLKKKYIDDNYDEGEQYIDEIEEMLDGTYFSYYKAFSTSSESLDDFYAYLKKDLQKLYRKNQLDTLFEKRAYRVLNGLSKEDIKKLDKELLKADKMSKNDKFLMYMPVIIISVIFAIGFGIAGYYIDKNIFADCLGRKHYESVIAFGFAGTWISLIVSLLLPNSIYKLYIKKDRYDSFIRMVNAQGNTESFAQKAVIYIFCIVGCIAGALFFTTIFCFNGIAFNNDAIVYKDFAFSQTQSYSFEDTEIAIVEGEYSNGSYGEYIDTAYAFKLDEDWYDYGVPDEEIKELIEQNIEKYDKDVKIYKSVEDIE